jgi:lambda repressor-like predicted transcriptional regulator
VDSAEILYLLKKKGCSQQKLASSLGVTYASVNNTIHQKTRSYRIANAIAELIESNVEIVFPGLYDPVNTKRRRTNKQSGEVSKKEEK